MGTASEDDIKGLFDDVDLTSIKLGSRENQKNDVVVEVLVLLSGIDFRLEDTKSDLLGGIVRSDGEKRELQYIVSTHSSKRGGL